MRTASVDEITPMDVGPGAPRALAIRAALGIRAFGVNAFAADAGECIIESHVELGGTSANHEELYVVLRGRATFTVDGERIDARPGTLVHVPEPAERREAVAQEDGTLVLVVGATPGAPFAPSPWEFTIRAIDALNAGDPQRAKDLLRDGLRRYPDQPGLLFNLACLDCRSGLHETALRHLLRAVEQDEEFRRYAQDQPDLAALKADPRFPVAKGEPDA